MGLFSKKNDVPELPRSSTLPRLTNASMNTNNLPSISNLKSDDVKNSMVKSAVTDDSSQMGSPMLSSSGLPSPMFHREESQEDHKKEVFVKLDKFKDAQKTFSGIKSKVSEIESLVRQARNLNEKEKTELNGWEEDMNNIKSKLSEIDSEIFNQI